MGGTCGLYSFFTDANLDLAEKVVVTKVINVISSRVEMN